nr:hypothetical protein CFP56_35201 [Quercus suber]
MEAYNNRKGGVYLLAFLAMLMLSAYCCSSAVLVESNSTSLCNGGLGECLLLEDDMEFPMNPYIRRGLSGPNHPAYETLNRPKPALPPCGNRNDPAPYCKQRLCRNPQDSYNRGRC